MCVCLWAIYLMQINSILFYAICPECMSTFLFNTRMKTPLHDCRIKNALNHFVPSCQNTRTQFVTYLDPPFRPSLASLTTVCSPPDLRLGCLVAKAWGIKSGVALVNINCTACSVRGHDVVETR